jgi:fumarate reductase subunit C
MATEIVRRPYVPRRSEWWFTKNRRYLLFQLRELSSVFVILYAFLILWELWALRGGSSSWAAFLDVWYSRPMMILNLVILAFVLLHTATWFLLTTRVPLFRIHGRAPPETLIVGSMVAIWAVASFLVLRFLYGVL